MQTVSVINQKGGVGKTTTAIELACRLPKEGFKTLLVDCDAAGNATTGLGFKKEERGGIYAALERGSVNGMTLPTQIDGLTLLPAAKSNTEGLLLSLNDRELALKRTLDGLDFDYIILDCPPSLGLLAVNALAASDSLIIPVQSEFYALEGLASLLNTVRLVKRFLNPKLTVDGILITLYSARERLSREVEAELSKAFGNAVYTAKIPKNVRIAEASSHGVPAAVYDKNCAGSVAYDRFVIEYLTNRRKNYA